MNNSQFETIANQRGDESWTYLNKIIMIKQQHMTFMILLWLFKILGLGVKKRKCCIGYLGQGLKE